MPIAMRRLRNGARCAAVIGMLSLSSISSAHAGDAPPLVPEAAIVLPHSSGRIDHLAIDRGRKWPSWATAPWMWSISTDGTSSIA